MDSLIPINGWDLGAFLKAAVALGISSFLKFSGDVSPEVGPEIEKKCIFCCYYVNY